MAHQASSNWAFTPVGALDCHIAQANTRLDLFNHVIEKPGGYRPMNQGGWDWGRHV